MEGCGDPLLPRESVPPSAPQRQERRLKTCCRMRWAAFWKRCMSVVGSVRCGLLLNLGTWPRQHQQHVCWVRGPGWGSRTCSLLCKILAGLSL